MAEELAYALITPYSLAKSRTGGIIGRLISQADVSLVGVHMYAPSDKFVGEYLAISAKNKVPKPFKDAFRDYVNNNLRRENALEWGYTNRIMLLLFKGKNARSKVREVVGPPTAQTKGDTIGHLRRLCSA